MKQSARWLVPLACAALASCTAIPRAAPVAPPPPAPPPVAVQALPAPRFVFQGQLVQGGVVTGTAPAGATGLTLDGAPVGLAPDGRFLIAFDRDAGPSAILIARLADGRDYTDRLTIAPRAWPVERLSTLPRFVRPDAEFQRIRAGELARIVAARSVDHATGGWRQAFIWPVTGRISGRFGAQRIYKDGEAGAYHSGTDIARPTGTPVASPADGVVVLAADAPFTIEGNLLIIDHGMGLNSAFLHLSRIDVREGDIVRQGQVVGAIGATGRATGPHLHWSLKWRGARVDPEVVAGVMTGVMKGE